MFREEFITGGPVMYALFAVWVVTFALILERGFYWLFRNTGTIGTGGSGFCNDPGITWGNAGRDAALP